MQPRESAPSKPQYRGLLVRTAHLKAMVMHAREQIFVLDVNPEGVARMQVYAYHERTLNAEEVVETGTVAALGTKVATTLLQDLVAAGMLPIIMVLQWRETGNHFQAVTYDNDRYKCYSGQVDTLSAKRNEILTKNGCRALDAIPYDARKTANAAARELKAIRKAFTANKQGTGSALDTHEASEGSDGNTLGRGALEAEVEANRGEQPGHGDIEGGILDSLTTAVEEPVTLSTTAGEAIENSRVGVPNNASNAESQHPKQKGGDDGGADTER